MKKIILLVDPPRKIEYVSLGRHDMEGYTPLEIELTVKAIRTFAPCVLHTNAEKFLKRLWLFKNDLVFPMMWGRGERNTKSIFPAVCEAKHIAYVGADVYTQTLCNDKFLAKQYAKAFGFHAPSGVLLFHSQSDEELQQLIHSLKLPIVVKPNFGGGSCGISDGNLVDTFEDAFHLAKILFANQYNPLLAEEYVPGNELSILLLGNSDDVKYCGESQLVLDGETYFDHRIWGYETKKLDFQRAHYQTCHLLGENEHDQAKKLFLSLPKAEYLRIDGRLNANEFHILEISADCYMGPNSDFCALFESMGKQHSDLLHFLVENALLSHGRGNSPIA